MGILAIPVDKQEPQKFQAFTSQ